MKNSLASFLFHQGTNYKTYDFLGAHFTRENGQNGVVFRVWAPNAASVSVIGDFNGWDKTKNVMSLIDNDGVWEEFIAGVKEFDSYKYAVTSKKGETVNKADPYAFHAETPPNTASKVYELSGYRWQDKEYFKNLLKNNSINAPMNVYEVNLASWKRHKDGSYLTYNELKTELVDYVCEMNYTHVEFMPVAEYPFDGSWGYQVTGYYAITSRFGTPKEFMALVDEFHKRGIGVIVDWVPAHFPKDEHGLIEFDGEPLYENHGKDRQENANWGTRLFDYGRTEVQSFLVSNAAFMFDKYHVDGLRVDAVASMLYLDYDKKPGEWFPNVYGDNKNLEAIAFFHKLNAEIFARFPYALMIAEESTANVKITGRIEDGALGFNYKWNMGWMNDALSYVETDPYFRKYHHNKLTFSMMYAYSENFVLPVSHDEVVHGKKSLLDKMPGDYEDKFAGNRAFMGYMISHPGKKLTFMGEEIGQFKEWNFAEGIEFFLLDYPKHRELHEFYKELFAFYKNNDAFYSIDDNWTGFEWLDADNADNDVIAYKRKGASGEEIIAVISFNGGAIKNYVLPVDGKKYKVVFNSDDKRFGGLNKVKKTVYNAQKAKDLKKPYKISLEMPKLSFVYLLKTE